MEDVCFSDEEGVFLLKEGASNGGRGTSTLMKSFFKTILRWWEHLPSPQTWETLVRLFKVISPILNKLFYVCISSTN